MQDIYIVLCFTYNCETQEDSPTQLYMSVFFDLGQASGTGAVPRLTNTAAGGTAHESYPAGY